MSIHSKKTPSRSSGKDMVLTIKTLNSRGEGIGFFKKYKIGVEKTLPGEKVRVRYLPNRPRKDRIQLQEILKTSPLRVTPPCPYFNYCGGCQLQHLPYSEQLKFKQQCIRQALKAAGIPNDIQIHPAEPMPVETRYRNKTQMPFGNRKNQVIYGLYHHGTHDLIDINYCLVESIDANQALQIVKQWAGKYYISAYSERENFGVLRHVVVRKGQFTHQVMVIIISSTKSLPHWKELVSDLRDNLPSLKSVILNYNPHHSNVILGDSDQVLWGEPFIEEKLTGISFRIYPNTFFQTNSVQTVRLIDKMINLVELRKGQIVLDLFCGTGTIGLLMAHKVSQVLGLDNNEDSIRAARENCDQNQISNAEFRITQVYSGFTTALPQEWHPDIVIVDPPRKGLPQQTVPEICHLKPEKIIYVSCHPPSLANNLIDLSKFGYQAKEIYPFDMFPHTAHVESMTILQRR
jgi:23S rRNA (uracil1939-C5)-methyltransferase